MPLAPPFCWLAFFQVFQLTPTLTPNISLTTRTKKGRRGGGQMSPLDNRVGKWVDFTLFLRWAFVLSQEGCVALETV